MEVKTALLFFVLCICSNGFEKSNLFSCKNIEDMKIQWLFKLTVNLVQTKNGFNFDMNL